MEPVRSIRANRPSPWNRGGGGGIGIVSTICRPGRGRNPEERSLSRVRPNDYGRTGAARISLLAVSCIISSDARDIAYSGHVFDALDAYIPRGIPNLLEERGVIVSRNRLCVTQRENRERAEKRERRRNIFAKTGRMVSKFLERSEYQASNRRAN